MLKHRKRVSGGADMIQLSHEHQLTGKADRKALKEELMKLYGNFKVEISPEQSLALKTNLQIPWRKLRVMKR